MTLTRLLPRVAAVAVSIAIYFLFGLVFSPLITLHSPQTPLAQAIENNDSEKFEALLDDKSVRAKSGYGTTPLSLAVREGNIEFVRKLLLSGADPNGRGDFGDSPVILSVPGNVCYQESANKRGNALKIAELLIEHGADVRLRNSNGETALLWAAGCGANDLVSLLINSGADPNIVAGDNATPIQKAIYTYQRMGDLSVIRTLIAAGANPFVRNSEKEYGRTAIDLANQFHDSALLGALMTGSNTHPLKPYLDERKDISFAAWRLSSMLEERGVVGIPIHVLNWIATHTFFILMVPTLLFLVVGSKARDNKLLLAGAAQPIIIGGIVFFLLLFGKDS